MDAILEHAEVTRDFQEDKLIFQEKVVGKEHVICYFNPSLRKVERKYSTTEQECLAASWAVEEFCPYLESYKFTMVTDHLRLNLLKITHLSLKITDM